MSDHRRTVESETPRWRAASEVVRPRRLVCVDRVMSAVFCACEGFAAIRAALRRFRRRALAILPLLPSCAARLSPSWRPTMSYVHTERVRFGDLDAMRHLNN